MARCGLMINKGGAQGPDIDTYLTQRAADRRSGHFDGSLWPGQDQLRDSILPAQSTLLRPWEVPQWSGQWVRERSSRPLTDTSQATAHTQPDLGK